MKGQKAFNLLLSIISMMLLISCGAMDKLGSFQLFPETKTVDYKSAGKVPALDIPPDLIKPVIDEKYAIPGLETPTSATFSSYQNERANPSQGINRTAFSPTSVEDVHLERAGTQRWLVVPQSPDAVWPVIKEFWQEMGFLIKVETPETGIMETDWAENRAKIPQDFIRNIFSTFLDSIYSAGERDKFRTRLERTEAGTTEIYISHRGMTEVVEGGNLQRTIWQPRPADPELEAEMLSRLMLRFGVKEEKAKMELASNRSNSTERAYIDPSSGDKLVINEAFDRSWRRVGLALDRIGFTVEDRNRAEGVYYVRYVNPEKDSKKEGDGKGILSNMMFWRSDDSKDGKAAKYRIQLTDASFNSSELSLVNDDGSSVDTATSNRILKLLHEQLR